MDVKDYRINFGFRFVLFALIAIGCLAWYLQFGQDHSRAWLNYLVGVTLFVGFGLCGLFFTAIQHITRAGWSVSIRRVMEAMALTLPVSIPLFGILLYGHHDIYEWSHPDVVNADPILLGKAGYLNSNFFGIRIMVAALLWIVCALVMVRNSMKQDASGAVELSRFNRGFSAFVLVVFGVSVSAAAFDLLMSLEPHWFSTMFGVYYFAMFFQAGLALMTILIWMLYKNGVLKDFISMEHFHDMGRFVFGFSVFWAYIAYSQFMLIWYGNLPEETFFFIERMKDGWQWLFLGIFILRFVLPFLILMPYGSKRNFKILLPVCVIILVAHWIELFWLAMPALRYMHHGEALHSALIAWEDVAIGVGFFALFVLCVGMVMEKIRMLPIRDPRLERSLHHH